MTNRLTMTWLLDPDADLEASPSIFLDACRELMVPAMPIVFGTREPFRQKFNEPEFVSSWFSESHTHWRSSTPFSSGAANNFDGSRVLNDIEVRLASEYLERPEQQEAARSFFYSLAGRLNCFYAEIAVERNAEPGRGPRLTSPSPTRSGYWCGLPLGDLWLSYFGDDYAHLLAPYLPLTAIGGGHGHEFTDAWQGPERRTDATFAGIVPAKFLVSLGNSILTGKPLRREQLHSGMIPKEAETIPERLRYTSENQA